MLNCVFEEKEDDRQIRRNSTVAAITDPATIKVLSFLPTVFCTSLVMSPILTCRDITKKGTIGALSPMPVVACANTCVVFTAFGSKLNDWVVMTPNIIGTVCSVYYLYTFHRYSPPGTMTKWYAGSVGVMGTSLLAAFDCLPIDPYKLNGLGTCLPCSLACTFSTFRFGTCDTRKINSRYAVSICCSINHDAASWVSYGLVVGIRFHNIQT